MPSHGGMSDAPELGTWTDPAVQSCPFAFLSRLHAEAPVYRDPVSGLWLITRYEDVIAALKDWETFSSALDMRRTLIPEHAMAIFEREGWVAPDVIIQKDGAVHARYRGLIDTVFSPAKVKAKEPLIEAHVARAVAALPDAGPIDFMQAFAVPVPLAVLAEQLGVAQEDAPRIKEWADAQIRLLGLMADEDAIIAAIRKIVESQHYFVARFEEKRANPGTDILSDLVALRFEDEDRPLTTEELLAISAQFMVAGHETTTSTLAKGVQILAERPELQARLRGEETAIRRFVDEAMRHEGVVQARFRAVTRDVEVAGTTIPKGSVAMLMLTGGNRDPARYPDPEAFDIDRPQARHHLTFGAGPHRCIGERLALAELRIAFRALLDAFEDIRLVGAPPQHHPHMFLHILDGLTIDYGRRG